MFNAQILLPANIPCPAVQHDIHAQYEITPQIGPASVVIAIDNNNTKNKLHISFII